VKTDKEILDNWLKSNLNESDLQFEEAHWQHTLNALDDADAKKGGFWRKIIMLAGVLLLGFGAWLIGTKAKVPADNKLLSTATSSQQSANENDAENEMAEDIIDTVTLNSSTATIINATNYAGTTATNTSVNATQEESVLLNDANIQQTTTTNSKTSNDSSIHTAVVIVDNKDAEQSNSPTTIKKQRNKRLNDKKLKIKKELAANNLLNDPDRDEVLIEDEIRNSENIKVEISDKGLVKAKALRLSPIARLKKVFTRRNKLKEHTINSSNVELKNKVLLTKLVDHTMSNNLPKNEIEKQDTVLNVSAASNKVENRNLKTNTPLYSSRYIHPDSLKYANTIKYKDTISTEEGSVSNQQIASTSTTIPITSVTNNAPSPTHIKSKPVFKKSKKSWQAIAQASIVSAPKNAANIQPTKLTPYFGVGYITPITKRWDAQIGLAYTTVSSLNYTYSATQSAFAFGGTTQRFSIENKSMYQACIPVNVSYKLGLKHSAQIGIGMSAILGVKSQVKDFTTNTYTNQFGYSHPYNRINAFGIIGYKYQILPFLNAQAQYQPGLTDMTNNIFLGNTITDRVSRCNIGLIYKIK
jgi:hypothetical protein